MPGYSIDELLSAPLFSGIGNAEDTPYYMPVSIGANSYIIDLRKYKRQTIDSIRPPADQSSEPGEQSLTQEGLWRRSQQTFHFGGGQEYFDDPDSDNPRRRFWTSKGVDVWQRRKLTLLKDTSNARASANTNLKVIQVGTRLAIVDGSTVLYVGDPTTAWTGGNLSTVTGGTGTVNTVTTDGNTIFYGQGTEVRTIVPPATASALLTATTISVIGYANQRLIAANNNILYEISRAGTVTTLYTHANPNFKWSVIASAPNAVYVAGSSADRSDIYALTALDATGALSPPIFCGSLPDGEMCNDIQYYGGALLLCTTRGLRLAAIGSNNSLNYGPVIEIVNGVLACEGQGEYVWFSWTNYDSGSTGLGRADLSHFTAEMVPAYASDLMATAQGSVLAVCTVGGRRYFSVSGVGFFAESANYVASGTFNTGRIRFSTIEKKIITAFDMRHEALPLGAEVQISTITEEGVTSPVGGSSLVNSLSPVSILQVNIEKTEAIQVQLTLLRATTPTIAPVVRRWTLYGLVTPVLSDEIVLPLIVKSHVNTESGEGQSIYYNTLEHFQYLSDLASSKKIIRYQEGKAGYNVYVSSVLVEPNDWNEDKSFFDSTISVRLVTVAAQ